MAKHSKQILIQKGTGEMVPFEAERLRNSLKRSGADEDSVDLIVSEITENLQPGTNTKKIYQQAFRMLKKNKRSNAARYKLKRAIMELGPTGYAFEKFIGRLFQHLGYQTQVGVVVEGKCVSHEIDVIADNDTERLLIECKYHNLSGDKSDVKVPLYIHSRFNDVVPTWQAELGDSKRLKAWIATNTNFSTDAIAYGNCAGLGLLSWSYPKGNGLKELIDRSGLFPVTCLTSLTWKEKDQLLEQGVMLSRDIHKEPTVLEPLRLSSNRSANVLKECSELYEQSMNGNGKNEA